MQSIQRFILMALAIITSLSFAHDSTAINKMFDKNWQILASFKTKEFHQDFKELTHLNIDIAGVDVKNNYIDVLLTSEDYQVLANLGYELEITQTKGISRGPDEEYKNPEEIALLMQEFADRFPEITHRVSIGKSLEGRDIWAIKISDNPETTEASEPSVLFNSMHHAREIMTPEVGLDIIETLLNGYNSDAKITKWINQYEIWVIPMFNVDGNNKMWNHDRWWRKNNRGGYGVDLNRNYPTGWNKCNGSSGWRSSQTYRGEKPASEPETQAMMNFIETVRPVFNISYHSYSELVLYPYGCSPERTATKDVVETIGKEMGRLLDYAPGTPWELLYNADGGDIDWMYEQYQVIPYVIEVNSRKQGFQPDYAQWRDKTVQRNRAGWQYLLERLEQTGIRGQLTQNQKALSDFTINVYKLDGNGKRSFYSQYVGQKTGYFHLVVQPGTYELEFNSGDTILAKSRHTVADKLAQIAIDISN
ncbi:MAG: hypothetical protein CME62_08585 [Halobacteriovoraceae bacterium]|nr:hypothetical protein [Halobacteriovoraceae bacterium]|tara:strand:+ start:6315 stop:7745 length:1431 start_codon:yes stop_codon:yes gene_type:complete